MRNLEKKINSNSLREIKHSLNTLGPAIIEKFGFFINPLLLNFKQENNHLLVFYFHGIFDSMKQKELNHIDPQHNMTVSQFTDFVDYFQNKKYIFIKPEDLHRGLTKDQRYIMLTFDDGYFNNTLAINVLNKYKIPAIFYITTKNMIENKSFWWDIIFKYRTKQGSDLNSIRKEQGYLKSLNYNDIDKYIIQNFGIKSFEPWSNIDRPFNKTEIKHLSKNPYVSIGNHTHNHSILTNYNRDEIKEELMESNKILYDLTGTLPISLAFPNGDYNNLVLEVTKESGFKYAFNTEPKNIFLSMETQSFICLSRFMSNTFDINKYGSFYRLGYDPKLLYTNLKLKTINCLKWNTQKTK